MLAQPRPEAESATAENPWYLRPFFGRGPAVPLEARRTLRLVALGLFFENYDMGLVSAALPQIAADLSLDADNSGLYLGFIRLGGIGTFLLLPLADRLGRKRLFMASFVGMSIGTLGTALTQTPLQFAAAQFLTRIFLLIASALALVIVVEEFPAHQRGAGLGLMTMLGGLGYALCAILYASVESLPYGWRALYLIGVAPVLLLPFFGRSLRETRRFEHQQRDSQAAAEEGWLQSWSAPMRGLVQANPRRALSIGLAAFFSAMGGIGIFQYTSYFVQEVRGWSPSDYALLVLFGGAIGVCGSVAGGRGSDLFGRRRVGSVSLLLAPLFAILFFRSHSAALALAWGGFIFFISAGGVILRALSAELFPTSHRSTSTGWIMFVQTLGWTTGLLVVGFATESIDGLGPAITLTSCVLVIASLALLAVPETRGRELETIND